MKKSISFVLFIAILLQSCVVYQKQSVSIYQAVEKGKVKVVTNSGRKVIFNNIIKEGGNYYGIYNFDRIPLDTTRTYSFYLKSPSYHYNKYYRIWVYRKDGNNGNPTQGYLYEVKDSSILVSLSNPIKKKPVLASSIREFQFYDIEKIKLRRIGNVGRGASIGLAIGVLPLLSVGGGEEWLYWWRISVPIAVASAGIGSLIGTTKKSYEINGSIEEYSIYRHELRDKAFIKPK